MITVFPVVAKLLSKFSEDSDVGLANVCLRLPVAMSNKNAVPTLLACAPIRATPNHGSIVCASSWSSNTRSAST